MINSGYGNLYWCLNQIKGFIRIMTFIYRIILQHKASVNTWNKQLKYKVMQNYTIFYVFTALISFHIQQWNHGKFQRQLTIYLDPPIKGEWFWNKTKSSATYCRAGYFFLSCALLDIWRSRLVGGVVVTRFGDWLTDGQT